MSSSTAFAPKRQVAAELARIPYGSPASEVAAAVERDGGVILTGALSLDEVRAINSELDAAGVRVNMNFVQGEDWGGKTKRLVHCVKHSPTLRRAFLDGDTLADYLAATLPGPTGSYAMFASHAIEIQPGESAQQLHRDAAGLMQIVGTHGPTSANLLVNFLIALTEVTEEMGATRVIPGSNHWPDYDAPGLPEQTIAATMNPGDALFFNGKVVHGGGANHTSDRVRRVISNAFGPGFLMGEEAWPHVISPDEARTYSKRVQRLIGYRSVSWFGEEPGFLWRAEGQPLEEYYQL